MMTIYKDHLLYFNTEKLEKHLERKRSELSSFNSTYLTNTSNKMELFC